MHESSSNVARHQDPVTPWQHTPPFFIQQCTPLLPPVPIRVPYLLLANAPGEAGPPGLQDLALFSMGRMFALLGLEAKAHFSQND